MLPSTIELEQALERHERYAAETLAPQAGGTRQASARRAIGLRLIALGRRLAADPSPMLARSR
jgi:hypothetical protein